MKSTKQAVRKDTKITVSFQIRYHTKFGESLYITGNHDILGNNVIEQAPAMQYLDNEHWTATIELPVDALPEKPVVYNYVLKNADGSYSYDYGTDKILELQWPGPKEIQIMDSWNHEGFYENVFYTEPFKNILLSENYTNSPVAIPPVTTHTFIAKAPLLAKGQALCIAGNIDELCNWATKEKPVLMHRKPGENCWSAQIDLTLCRYFPIVYKYGIYDIEKDRFIAFETGDNRTLYDVPSVDKHTIVNDGFAVFPNNTWRGAGVAIPVFGLRSKKSLGTGEFSDIKLLIDWAKQTGLRLIQLLPVNDTTATHTWRDSYPYAAISAFALHPLYLNIEQVLNEEQPSLTKIITAQKKKLNGLSDVDYEAVMKVKLELLRKIYQSQSETTFASKEYKKFFKNNKHWLAPYAAFSYLRDKFGTPDFNKWPVYNKYHVTNTLKLLSKEDDNTKDAIAFYYFIQYHLHIQLQEAVVYAHKNGIILKGDIAIGVYRFSVDVWQQPDLYHTDLQAGAPPDGFAAKGQNWGFPTYNWERMQKDGFLWWKQRLEQMGKYFDTFRLDHILGFFRIWSIPTDAVEGIMGHFAPSISVHLNEFAEHGIQLDHTRYTKPFINEHILEELFGNDKEYVKNHFLVVAEQHHYTLLPEFTTQQLVAKYFEQQEKGDRNAMLQQGLFDLISNIILFEQAGSKGTQFHFRFDAIHTASFRHFNHKTKENIRHLYINYFYRRQESFWQKEALQKLPALKSATNMLICGEDLGFVPHCVPEVMKQYGILSLEIQRMPKNTHNEFSHPANAPYLSVISPSTHDMSTIRGWWEEDRDKSQRFFHHVLGEHGDTPFFCEAWINKAIVAEHLHSPAMWSIFQLQDLLGIDAGIRRENPHEEQINIPSNPDHCWKYRMHLTLEELLKAKEYNKELYTMVEKSRR